MGYELKVSLSLLGTIGLGLVVTLGMLVYSFLRHGPWSGRNLP